jgi:hypothetical protein
MGRKMKLSTAWRDRIRIGELMDRLQRHAFDECEMSRTQISAAKLLLSKVAPDLRSIEHGGEVNHNVDVSERTAGNIAKAIAKAITG